MQAYKKKAEWFAYRSIFNASTADYVKVPDGDVF